MDPSVAFSGLTTPMLADACLRHDVELRLAPVGIAPVGPGTRLAGRVRPVRHAGSVDVFLEALEAASPGDVLVIDNEGRRNEACIGDLVALEVKQAGLAGMIVWGCHRDTVEIREIGLPMFSYGAVPTGPLGVRQPHPEALASAEFGECVVGPDDVVFADADGVLFAPSDRLEAIVATAMDIRDTERRQAGAMAAGTSLRRQLDFDAYLAARNEDPRLTFRQHLRSVGGEIEE